MTIDVLSCVANGQPGDLLSCLDGYVKNAVGYGRSPRVVVVDQTSDPARRNVSRRIAAKIHRLNKVDIEYISNRDLESFLIRAAKLSWVDIDSLRYALLGDDLIGPGYGAACNIALLAAGGSSSFVVDSSTRCSLVGFPGGRGASVVIHEGNSGKYDPLFGDAEAIRFFDSAEEAESKLPQNPDEDLFGEADKALLRASAVSLGTWRDVGLETPGFYLLSRQASAVASDDLAYARNRLKRTVHRSAVDHVSGGLNLRAQAFGFDPSSCTLPFLPIESVEGGFAGQSLFGVVLRCLRPQSVAALPFAVKKLTAAQAFSPQDPKAVVREISLTDFFSVILGSLGSAKSLADLGNGMMKMARMDSFVQSVAGTWSMCMSDLAKARSGEVGSDLMRADILSMVSAGEDWRARPVEELVPYEFKAGPQPAATLFRQISQFGRLLVAWPGLVAAVSDLSKNGVWLGANP